MKRLVVRWKLIGISWEHIVSVFIAFHNNSRENFKMYRNNSMLVLMEDGNFYDLHILKSSQ